MPAPRRIAAGRVVLELLGPDDAARVADAINADLDHLRPWMPWAHRPTNAQEQAMRLAVGVENAERDLDATYSITVDGMVVGGCGLHRRTGEEDTRHIGYWISADHQGHGYVSEAVAGLTRVAFEHYGVRRVRITCDEANLRSAAVARRLGFEHEATVHEERSAPSDTHRTMVWVLDAARWPHSPGYDTPVSYA